MQRRSPQGIDGAVREVQRGVYKEGNCKLGINAKLGFGAIKDRSGMDFVITPVLKSVEQSRSSTIQNVSGLCQE